MAPWSRPVAAAAILAVTFCGCGGNDAPKETVPATVTDAIRQLARRAALGDIDGVLAMLTDDARQQNGKAWIQFVARTGGDTTRKALAALLRTERRTMETADTQVFLKTFYENHAEGFSRLFEFFYMAEYEEGGRLLAYVHNGRGDTVYLAFSRESDGGLKLMGETRSGEVLTQLRQKLEKQAFDGP